MNETDIYDARSAFVDRYCGGKSWDAKNLNWEQISEIRAQPEWNQLANVDGDEARSVVRRDGPNLYVYEWGEFCCVCESTEHSTLQRWAFGEPDNPLTFTVCGPCHSGDAFRSWLAGEFERAMIVHDENRKLPDGRWTTKKYDPACFESGN